MRVQPGAIRRTAAGRRSAAERTVTPVTAHRLAWLLCATAVAATLAEAVLITNIPGSPTAPGFRMPSAIVGLLMLSWAVTGAIVASRRPGNPIGWLLLGVGVAQAAGRLTFAYTAWVLETAAVPVVPLAYVALAGAVLWIPRWTGTTLTLLLFPSGRAVGQRWRMVTWLTVVTGILFVPTTVLGPGPLRYLPGTDNPLGADALAGLLAIGQRVVAGTAIACSLLAIAGVVLRYRRARGVERQQLRWFAMSLIVMAVGTPLAMVYDDTAFGANLFEVLWALPPIAVGVAVLRYRLYDLDRLVSRTLTYAVVTAVLVGVYATIAVLPSAVFDLDSDLLIAAATLSAAGVFVPVRRRAQALVDRRFNRGRYDAARVVEQFTGHVRDDVDLDSISSDIHRVVNATMQPTRMSLWIRHGTH